MQKPALRKDPLQPKLLYYGILTSVHPLRAQASCPDLLENHAVFSRKPAKRSYCYKYTIFAAVYSSQILNSLHYYSQVFISCLQIKQECVLSPVCFLCFADLGHEAHDSLSFSTIKLAPHRNDLSFPDPSHICLLAVLQEFCSCFINRILFADLVVDVETLNQANVNNAYTDLFF